MTRRLAAAAAALAIAGWACGGAGPPSAAARLAVLAGSVAVQRGGAGPVPGRSGDLIDLAYTVLTAAGASARIDYPDGSWSRLDGSTSLQLNALAPETLTQTRGRTWNVGAAGGLRLRAPGGVTATAAGPVTVLLAIVGGGAEFDLFEGSAEVTAAGGRTRLSGAQSASVRAHGAPGPAQPIPQDVLDDPFTLSNRPG